MKPKIKTLALIVSAISLSNAAIAQTPWTGTALTGDSYRTGNVGIGTSAPATQLEVLSTGTQLRLSNTSSIFSDITTTSAGHLIFSPNTGKVGFGPSTSLALYGFHANLGKFLITDPASATTRGFIFQPQQLQNGDLPYGSCFTSAVTTSGEGLSIVPDFYGNPGVTLGAYAYNGSNFTSMWETQNVSTGLPNLLLAKNGGNVGVGTSSPSYALSVHSNENQTTLGLNKKSVIHISNNYSNAFGRRSELQFGLDQDPNNTLAVIAAEYTDWNSDVAGDLVFGTNPVQSNSVVERMRITHDGKVNIKGQTRIGITKPTGTHADAMLSVDGKIVSKSIYVTSQNWADFVFDKEYQMPTLYDIEKYYLANHHLPEVPSEKDVIENGINIAEMNKILLRKIEELTILMVSQQKQIDVLQHNKN